MTTWADEGGEVQGVLVKRLRRIPEQAAEVRRKALQRKEEERRTQSGKPKRRGRRRSEHATGRARSRRAAPKCRIQTPVALSIFFEGEQPGIGLFPVLLQAAGCWWVTLCWTLVT